MRLVTGRGILLFGIISSLALPWKSPWAQDPPTPPKPIAIPYQPVTPASPGGYLPGSGSVSPTGQYGFTLPIEVPNGRAGMQPALSLVYSGGAGNGPLGVGWSLGGLSSITRCGSNLASNGYTDGVSFTPPMPAQEHKDNYCLDGQPLVAISGNYGAQGTEYRTENDGFTKVVSELADAQGPTRFKVWLKNGRVRIYQAQTANRYHRFLGEPLNPPLGVVESNEKLAWLLQSETDRSENSNTIAYTYSAAAIWGGIEILLHRIDYTSSYDMPSYRHVDFIYEDRPDDTWSWMSGVRMNHSKRLRAIEMWAPNPTATSKVWRYDLSYVLSPGTQRSMLSSVKRCGALGGCLWSKNFDWYQTAAPTFAIEDWGFSMGAYIASGKMHVADFDGDGADDLLYGKYLLFGAHDRPPFFQDTHTPLLVAGQGDFHNATEYESMTARPLDHNGDGKADLFISRTTDDSSSCGSRILAWDAASSTFLNSGAPTLGCGQAADPDQLLMAIAETADFADFDGDRTLDKLYTKHFATTVNWAYVNQIDQYVGGTLVDHDAKCPNLVVDLNGDGRGEVVTATKVNGDCTGSGHALSKDDAGQWVTSGAAVPGGTPGQQYFPATGDFYDFNGDGLEDNAHNWYAPDESLHTDIRWNSGHGFYNAKPGVDLGESVFVVPAPNIVSGGAFADFNADGRTDRLSIQNVGKPTASAKLWLSTSSKTKLFNEIDLTATLGVGALAPDAAIKAGDFNGDGRLDFAYVSEGHIYIAKQVESYGDLLKRVKDEPTLWANETIEYSNDWAGGSDGYNYSCQYPLSCPKGGMTVVRKVTSNVQSVDPQAFDAIAASTPYSNIPLFARPYVVHYAYEDPVSHLRGRGFLGFGKTTTWDPQTGVETVTLYDHRTSVQNGKYYPFAHRPQEITVIAPILTAAELAAQANNATARVTRSTFSYELKSTNLGLTYVVQPTGSSSMTWEDQVQIDWVSLPWEGLHIEGVSLAPELLPPLVQSTSESVFDAYGNVTSQTNKTIGGITTVATITYENRTADWLLGLPLTTTIKRTDANNASAQRRLDFTHDTRGRPKTRTVEQGNPDTSVTSTTTFDYDNYSSLISTKVLAPNVAVAREVRVRYEQLYPGAPSERIYASQVWEPRFNGQYQASVWSIVHPGLGVPVATMDVNGGAAQMFYDDLARPTKIIADGSEPTTFQYAGRPDAVGGFSGLIVSSTIGGATNKVITDALGRALTSSTTGFDGIVVSTSAAYDKLGRVVRQSVPYTNAATVFNANEYDSLGRLLKSTAPDGAAQNLLHSFFETHVWDALGAEHYAVRDIDGRTKLQVDVLDGAKLETSSTYGPFDELLEMSDPKGNLNTLTYDAIGRTKSAKRTGTGRATSQYNGLGDLLSSTREGNNNAVTETTVYTLDDLGRVISRKAKDGVHTYNYDTKPNGIGAPASIWSASQIGQEFSYDSIGRLAETLHKDLGTGKNYAVTPSYDATTGYLAMLAYPNVPGRNRFQVKYSYNAFGYLKEIGDATPMQNYKPLWTATARTLTQASDLLGNGVTSTQTFDNRTGRLQQILGKTGGGTQVMDLRYFYYANGLVESRLDGVAKRDEFFDYDDLQRVTGWKLKFNNVTTDTGYAYDTIGNLTDVTKNNAVIQHNTYGANGVQPHALLQQVDATTGSANYGYDGFGRQVKGAGRTLTYVGLDLPTNVKTNSGVDWTFTYDALGQRVKKSGTGGTTYYVPGLYESRSASSTTGSGTITTHVFHVAGIADVTYQEGAAVSNVEYQLGDALGSSSVSLDANGAEKYRYFFEPFGARTDSAGNPLSFVPTPSNNHHGFTGHEHDDPLGLINMRGRMYDPKLKRFMTPDPIVANPGSSQGWNAYSYVSNSPLNLIDPSGYRAADATGVITCAFTPQGAVDMECSVTGSGGSGAPPTPMMAPVGQAASSSVSSLDSTHYEVDEGPGAVGKGWVSGRPVVTPKSDATGYSGAGGAPPGEDPRTTILKVLTATLGGQPSLLIEEAYHDANTRPDAGVDPTELPPGGLDYSAGVEGGLISDPLMLEVTKTGADVGFGLLGRNLTPSPVRSLFLPTHVKAPSITYSGRTIFVRDGKVFYVSSDQANQLPGVSYKEPGDVFRIYGIQETPVGKIKSGWVIKQSLSKPKLDPNPAVRDSTVIVHEGTRETPKAVNDWIKSKGVDPARSILDTR